MTLLAATLLALPASAAPGDADGDGVPDASDNCTLVANADQFDADNDGYGNACDGDLDGSGRVTTADHRSCEMRLNTNNAAADLNHDGSVTSCRSRDAGWHVQSRARAFRVAALRCAAQDSRRSGSASDPFAELGGK